MKDLDVEELEILATLDSHTSSICRHMDRKRVRVVDAKPGVTVPPFHCYAGLLQFHISQVSKALERGEIRTIRVLVHGAITHEEWEKNISISSGNALFYTILVLLGDN